MDEDTRDGDVDVAVEGNTLTVGDAQVTVRHPVRATLRAGDVVVVLLDPGREATDAANVLGVSTEGELRWTVDSPVEDPSPRNEFVDLYRRDGDVWAGTWVGHECRLDPETGAVLERVFRK